MKFSKQNKTYFDKELQGNISNYFKFMIKDLYKAKKTQSLQLCSACSGVVTGPICKFCQKQTMYQENKSKICKNVCSIVTCQQDKKSIDSLILCIDLSQSMDCTYRSTYKKINKDYVVKQFGQDNFDTLAKMIGEKEVVKNYKNIQSFIQCGQTLKDIGYSLKKQLEISSNKSSKGLQYEQLQDVQYISRKQIIQIGISKYIETIFKQRPNTMVTVVYFNSNIHIPVNNFNQELIITNLQDKSIEQMIQLGSQYAKQISISKVKDIGDKLTQNMVKAKPTGLTALGPAVSFCIGLAKQFKHDLHQIVIVTDGLANIGFGQTQQVHQLQQSSKIYQRIAIDYAVKYGCIFNVICFEDTAIGYEVIDQLVKNTNGLPYQISLIQEKNQKTVTSETIDFLIYQMKTGFSEAIKQFCFDTKICIQVSNPKIMIIISDEYKKFIKKKGQNYVTLQMGIRSFRQNFQFVFTTNCQQLEGFAKFTLSNQYRRKNKKHYAIRQQIITIQKGNSSEAVIQQSNVLTKQIKQQLRILKPQEDDYQQYQNIQKKLQNKQVANHIDEKILARFNEKKKFIEEYDKSVDKLTKDKKTIDARRNQTYKNRKVSSDEEVPNAFD